MTPHETAKAIHRELSAIAPGLSAAINRALLDIGEGSLLVGLGPGTHGDDPATFSEIETILLKGAHPAEIFAKIAQTVSFLEEHSVWKIIIDKKPGHSDEKMELLYTLFRERRCST
jgi:hypothetical protein